MKAGDYEVQVSIVVDVVEAPPVGATKVTRRLLVGETGKLGLLHETGGLVGENGNRSDASELDVLERRERNVGTSVPIDVHDAHALIGEIRIRVALQATPFETKSTQVHVDVGDEALPGRDQHVDKAVAVEVCGPDATRAEIPNVDSRALRDVDESAASIVAIETVVSAPGVPVEQIQIPVVVEIREDSGMRLLGDLLRRFVLVHDREKTVVLHAGLNADLLEPRGVLTEIPEQQVRSILLRVEDVSDVDIEPAVPIDVRHLDAVTADVRKAREAGFAGDVAKRDRRGLFLLPEACALREQQQHPQESQVSNRSLTLLHHC